MSLIRNERKKAGLTQMELARLSGIDQRNISRIEKKGRGDWEFLRALAKAIAEATNDDPAAVLGRFGFSQEETPAVTGAK